MVPCKLNPDDVTFIPEKKTEYFMSNMGFKNSNVSTYIPPLLEGIF